MSAVKHKPATPLPFREYAPEIAGTVEEDYRHIEGGRGYHSRNVKGNGFSFSGYIDPQDAAYIAHAANEYPRLFDENEKLRADRAKLVEALRAALKSQDEYGHIGAGTHDVCEALLRSLGEDA